MDRDELLAGIENQPLKRKNVTVMGRRTSLRMEPNIWEAFLEIGRLEKLSANEMCTIIFERLEEKRKVRNTNGDGLEPGEIAPGAVAPYHHSEDQEAGALTLTAAIRVFIMNYYRRVALDKNSPNDGQDHRYSRDDDRVGVGP